MSPRASIIIPAHNESAVIGRSLELLLRDAADGEFDIIVVCNGCTDDTFAVASNFAPRVRVENLSTPGKTGALNRGDEIATTFPRVYLDADIDLSTDHVRRLIATLDTPEPRVAAPKSHMHTGDRPWFIRSFYRAWQRTEFMQSNAVGNGVYAMNAAGRARFDTFPNITADDLFVYALFSQDERICPKDVKAGLHTPMRLADLFRVRRRVYYGNAEMARTENAPADPSNSRNSAVSLLRASKTPKELFDAVVYLGVNTAAKVSAKRQLRSKRPPAWDRDLSSRETVRS